MKIIRKLLPRLYSDCLLILKIKRKIFYLEELPFHMHVRQVEYIENGCERLIGTLYMTTFRLVFAPDNDLEDNNLVYHHLKN
jgi:hypothetical protein